MTRLAEAHPPGLTYRLILTADVTMIRLARKLAEVALSNWNFPHLHLAVTTVVSELATNASKEVPGAEIEVGLLLRGGWLRLEVWDSLDVVPEVPAELDLDSEGGRGLWVAANMADKFGIDPCPESDVGGKTVWAMWMCGQEEAADV